MRLGVLNKFNQAGGAGLVLRVRKLTFLTHVPSYLLRRYPILHLIHYPESLQAEHFSTGQLTHSEKSVFGSKGA